MSARLSKPRSAPRRSARSTASCQSERAVPGGVTRRTTWVTRPSMFVVVPSVSANPVAGSTTVARRADSVRNRSIATTRRAPMKACSASEASGKSPSGSAPSSTSVSIRPSAAARRMPAASSPSTSGTRGHAAPNHSAASARRTRPGNTPGANPALSAPITLPRRSAGRKVASGKRRTIAPIASTTVDADSATDGRPITTVIGPDACASRSEAAAIRPASTPAAPTPAAPAPYAPAIASASTPASPGR